MRFAYEINRKFIGQERIIRELSIYAEEVKLGTNLNLLFKAPAGYGKNLLAYLFLEYVDKGYKNSLQYFPEDKKINFDPRKRFHYVDEVHMIRPQETLYPFLSSGEFTIILGTTDFDSLADPLVTRCIQIEFSEYSLEELALMIQINLEKKGINLEYFLCKEIAQYCRGVPRIAVENYYKRLSLILKHESIPETVEDIHELMFEYLGSRSGGYTQFDEQYLEALELNGGVAGLDTLVALTGLPRKTIVEDIEPFLIKKERITRTNRGRKLCITTQS